jgi:hypothetical protein
MKKKGVATIIEAVVASLLLISVFSVSFFLISTPSIPHQRYSEDLTKVGYNLLSGLAVNDGFDGVLYDSNGNMVKGWEQQLTVVINTLIPNNIIFNVTVYEALNDPQTNMVIFKILNNATISNTLDNNGHSNELAFLNAGENADVSYIYTTKLLHILVIDLKLATLGGV